MLYYTKPVQSHTPNTKFGHFLHILTPFAYIHPPYFNLGPKKEICQERIYLLLMKSWERLKNSILKRLSELLRSLDGSPQEAEGVEAHLGREQTPRQSYFSCCCDTYPDKTVEGRIGFFWLVVQG